MFYFVKTPLLIKKLYRSYSWDFPTKEKKIYLTFDDGPHPSITPFVLDELKKYKAKATFFCLGKNIIAFPETFSKIFEEGHRVGNHTHHHMDGWKTDDSTYLSDVEAAGKYMDTNLFRPPYGHITKFQANCLMSSSRHYQIVMWDVLSADFDIKINGEKCARNVTEHAREGSIIVFHDSEKAFDRLKVSLPMVMRFFSEKGFSFEAIK